MSSISAAVIDGDAFMAEAFAAVLRAESGIEVVGAATDPEAALEVIQEHQPRVVIIDMGIGDDGGLQLANSIRETSAETGLVFIGGRPDPALASQFMFLDPSGKAFLNKNEIGSVDRLIRAVRVVADGSTLMDDDFFKRFLSGQHQHEQEVFSNLTKKERQVLACIAEGDSNAVISEKLTLRARTVENYVANIFTKLGARRRTGRDPRVQVALHYLTVVGKLQEEVEPAKVQ
jgi:DNA-binding NarL/FixJ family response regulator